MSNPNLKVRRRHGLHSAAMVISLWLCAPSAPSLAVTARAADEAKRVPVATSASQAGALLRRESGKSDWHIVSEKEPLTTGDLLLGVPAALIDSDKGAATISFHSDL